MDGLISEVLLSLFSVISYSYISIHTTRTESFIQIITVLQIFLGVYFDRYKIPM